MGCSGSKTVKVTASSSVQSISATNCCPETHDLPNIDVFIDHSDNNNDASDSCHNNAKPRLRSAIRRGDSDRIKPVISEPDPNPNTIQEQQEFMIEITPAPLHFDAVETPFLNVDVINTNRDSGFDSNRANSEASECGRFSKEDRAPSALRSGRLSHDSFSSSRPGSVMTASVVTTRDLNASFMTISDDFGNSVNDDLTFDMGTPLDDLGDFEDVQPRTVSNTPSRSLKSVEPTPIIMYPKTIGAIKEESEGGFTPRSIFTPDVPSLSVVPTRQTKVIPKTNLPKYPSDEVLRHNQDVGWCEWGIHQGMVYATSNVISAFDPIYSQHLATAKTNNDKRQNGESHDASYGESSDDGSDLEEETEPLSFGMAYPRHIINPTQSLGRALRKLREVGIDKDVISETLSQCVIGEVDANAVSQQFWNEFRRDVNGILDDLVRSQYNDELTPNTQDILDQVRRWVRKYEHQNPQPLPPFDGDPNIQSFDLPEEIQRHPECLRRWIELWERFDLDVPDSGAWFSYPLEETELEDSHEIFVSSLRNHFDDEGLDHCIDGDVAWREIELRLFADDVMTEEQRRTEESRKRRTDLENPHRMKRRRDKLLQYFIVKYELDERKVSHFNQWSVAMEEGEKRFLLLCEN